MNDNFQNQESENTVVGNSPNSYMNVGGQGYNGQPYSGGQVYGGQPYGGQGYGGQPNGVREKKGISSVLIGILIGVVVAMIAGIGFILYSNNQKQAEENARLQEQHRLDSLEKVLAEEKATADAEAARQAAEAAKAEAEEAKAKAAAEAAKADAARFATASGTYSGRVAGSRYTLYLTQSGESITGSGSWNGSSNRTDIYGTIYGKSVELEEWSDGYQTGYMSGTISGKYFKGTFTNDRGSSYSFTLTR